MVDFDLVNDVIKDAGQAILKYYDTDYHSVDKEDNNPVTDADFASEKIIIDGLKQYGYGILSEEGAHDNDRLNKKYVWIIDPLDGTKDFIQKTGEFSVLVGLVENGRPIFGAIYWPVKDKLYFAKNGDGAFIKDGNAKLRALHVSSKENFSEMSLLVSRNHLRKEEQLFAKKVGIDKLITFGSAGLKSMLIAEQKADIYINSSDKTWEWDVCAADIIIKEAGGALTDMNGSQLIYNKKDPRNLDGFVVSNGLVHPKIIEFFK